MARGNLLHDSRRSPDGLYKGWKRCHEAWKYNQAGFYERVKNAYFAYLQLARAINTSIAQYNKRFPDYTLETLENVPEPNFLNSVDSLQNFFAETLKSFKSFEENWII